MCQIIHNIWREKSIPSELKKSFIIPIYKQKGDALECKNYRGIKLLEHALKIIEGIMDKRLRRVIDINETQFGFIPGRSTVDAIFILQQMQEKALEGNRTLEDLRTESSGRCSPPHLFQERAPHHPAYRRIVLPRGRYLTEKGILGAAGTPPTQGRMWR